ncbi:hypothetical protein [Pseudolactococcus chungangensis]|jgi:hypothetical protein|uniref:hypothetical protein n=1 Tax=Pseudolactococcus chungangensis TaxID=451457 RepID=UPI0028D11AAF|nr:hypothetical protein [Lactococcus chungangensis]
MGLFKFLKHKNDETEQIDDMNLNDLDDFDEFDDEYEGINVYDAALIWQSNGRDEDYTFGYNEEELRMALED